MNNIQTVFEKFLEINKNILICLDDTFCFAKSPESKPKNYISITSISDKEEVIECLKEEGSSVINFKISAKGKLNTNITKVVNSLVCILVENSFEPFLFSLLSNEIIVSIVISDRDIRIDDSDYYDSQDSENDDENENNNEEDIEKSEDEEDIEKTEDEDIEKSEDEDDIEKSEDEDDVEKSEDEKDVEKSEDEEDVEKSEDEDIEKSEDEDEENVEKSDDDEKDVEKSDDDEEDVEKSDDDEENVENNTSDMDEETNKDEDEEDSTYKNKKISKDINQYIQSIKNSTKQINKLKRPELIEHLCFLGVKKIDGEYLRKCTKESLLKKIDEFLKK